MSTTKTYADELEEYVAKVVAEAPPLDPDQIDRVAVILGPGKQFTTTRNVEAERRKAKIMDAQADLRKARKSMTDDFEKCGICQLLPVAHNYQAHYGMGYHRLVPMTPDQIVQIATASKARIKEAESALEALGQKVSEV